MDTKNNIIHLSSLTKAGQPIPDISEEAFKGKEDNLYYHRFDELVSLRTYCLMQGNQQQVTAINNVIVNCLQDNTITALVPAWVSEQITTLVSPNYLEIRRAVDADWEQK